MNQTKWTFESSSGHGTYTTERHADGTLSCNCKGWTIKKGDRPRECKHTRQVEALTGIAASQAAPSKPAPKLRSALPAPMLASAMVEPVKGAYFDHVYRGWLMEEKHDGHRVMIVVEGSRVSGWSRPRAGAEGALPRELPVTIEAAFAHLSDGIYDGELIVPGGKSWDVSTIGTRLVFVAFDLLEVKGRSLTNKSYSTRRDMLLDQLAKLPQGQTSVTTVESKPASWADVQAIWKRGGEGAILKYPNSIYRPGYRSPDWVKVKESNAATLTLTRFVAGKNGPYSTMELQNDEGHLTTVKVLGNDMLREVARNPKSYIGKRVVISYQLRTPSGSYRHPQFDHFAGKGE